MQQRHHNIAMKRKVEIFSPIDDEVKFTEDAGKYAGMFVRDADEKIVQDIKDKNALVTSDEEIHDQNENCP